MFWIGFITGVAATIAAWWCLLWWSNDEPPVAGTWERAGSLSSLMPD